MGSAFLRSLLVLCTLSGPAFAVDLSFQADFQARYGYHLRAPTDLATHRHILEITQEAKMGRWLFVGGGRAYAETAFVENSRYHLPVRELETQDYRLRDFYLQYKGANVHVTIGNQQVVWGEAFGFYFADIVNPKDLRENGMGDLTYQRLMAPMASSVVFMGGARLQMLVIPKTYFNILPAVGNDFSPDYATMFPGSTVTVNRIDSLDWFTNPEFGARIGGVLRGWDMSVFALNYFDRTPVYSGRVAMAGAGSLSLVLEPTPLRIWSLGATVTKDLRSWIQRAEIVVTPDRAVNTVNAALLPTASPIGLERHPEIVGVLGFDYTQWAGYRLGFQISHRRLLEAPNNLLIATGKSLASVNWGGNPYKEHQFDVVLSYVPEDGSSLLNASYMIPAASGFEFTLGGQFLSGGSSSQFGQFQRGSRAYLALRAYFGAGK